MGKKKSNSRDSENGSHIAKLNESPIKNRPNSTKRPKVSLLASLFFIILIGSLSILLGLIFIEINSSNKDMNSRTLKYESIKEESFSHHVKESQLKPNATKKIPSHTTPLSESEVNMEDDGNRSSSMAFDAGSSLEPPLKKPKTEENIKEEKIPDLDLAINEAKLKEIESQILQESSDELEKNKHSQMKEKEEPSTPYTEEKLKDENVKDSVDKKSEEKKSETTLKDLYIEVEALADEILKEDPENSMVKELAPHLEGVLHDLEGGKLSGLRDSLLHIKIILSDLKERLEEAKHLEKPDVSKPSKSDGSSKTEESRIPVDEVIPDPIYIAPLGGANEDPSKSKSKPASVTDKISNIEEEVAEKKVQEQFKEPSNVNINIQQSSSLKENEKKPDTKSQETKTENIKSNEKIDQSTTDSVKDPNSSSKKNSENKESKKLKDDLGEKKISDKIKEKTDEKPSKVESEKKESSLDAENKGRVMKEQETLTMPKLKTSQEKVKLDEKNQVVDGKKLQEPDKKNLGTQETKQSNNKEPEVKIGIAENSLEQPSRKPLSQESPKAGKERESEFSDNDLSSDKKVKNRKSNEETTKHEQKSSPELHGGKIEPKPTKVDIKIKDTKYQENLKASSKEAQSSERVLRNEKQQVPINVKQKTVKMREDKTSIPTSSNEKVPVETLKHKDDMNSEVEEKLKKASALEDENLIQALSMYDSLLQEMPKSPTVLYRRALVIDKLAEKEQSNPRLEQAVEAYLRLVDMSSDIDIPKEILKKIGLRCADRMNFRGSYMHGRERKLLRFLTEKFSNDKSVLNKIGIFYLLMNRNEEGGNIFKKVLELFPEDGFALVHYGLVLKLESKDEASLIEAKDFLERGIKSDAEGVHDVRMYYHLGDALQRLGQNERAYQVFDEGVRRGLFKSRYQRSTHNVNRLTAKPIWTVEETTYQHFFKKIQSHWKEISREAVLALKVNDEDKRNFGYRNERENLREKGSWKQFELFVSGVKHAENCKVTPYTCSLIEDFQPAAGCKIGQTKFSVIEPGTHVYSHTGPTNCRLRSHLGLVTSEGARMRVVNETITWEEGKFIIFDDSFEHEVWHDGNSLRLVLIIDVWHPELSENEIRTMKPF